MGFVFSDFADWFVVFINKNQRLIESFCLALVIFREDFLSGAEGSRATGGKLLAAGFEEVEVCVLNHVRCLLKK